MKYHPIKIFLKWIVSPLLCLLSYIFKVFFRMLASKKKKPINCYKMYEEIKRKYVGIPDFWLFHNQAIKPRVCFCFLFVWDVYCYLKVAFSLKGFSFRSSIPRLFFPWVIDAVIMQSVLKWDLAQEHTFFGCYIYFDLSPGIPLFSVFDGWPFLRLNLQYLNALLCFF